MVVQFLGYPLVGNLKTKTPNTFPNLVFCTKKPCSHYDSRDVVLFSIHGSNCMKICCVVVFLGKIYLSRVLPVK